MAISLYPNQLPRTLVVQAAVTLVLGALGAALGHLIARRFGWGASPSEASTRFAVYATTIAAVVWLLWQNALREASGTASVGPAGFAVLVVTVLGVPFLVATVWASRRRARTVVVAMIVGVAGAVSVAAPATATPVDSRPHSQRFAEITSATPGIRVYGALSDGATPAARAASAVDRMIASGGLRHPIVIAVPTGSGWVDPHFVRGVEESLRGDSTIIAVQYTQQPSWQSFVLHRDAAASTSAAVIEALHHRAPGAAVRLFGQSLGAVGVVAARERAEQLGVTVLSTLQSGTPAGVAIVGPVQLNASDPVGIWSPSLLVEPPDREATTPGRATPRPPWAPVLSFVQATADLLGATAPPPGLGHRYDERQGADLVRGVRLPSAA
ncbi:alpha/beta-hydrolase family protein [Tsukamurella sp. 1534]|uniref:alpha/beta-hydrolase family protein n=1 Tax=Tsukamurella sp. 1534 TaxID=1151061 RepID=UPI0011D18F7F|nr:alpha/beta-hydrolase family protein [Tsukamurella sp. 1534]